MNIRPGLLSDAENKRAKRTCARCKESKKKCDKELPSCARCSRLLIEKSRLSLSCAYDEPSNVPDATAGSEFLLEEILRRLDKIENHLFQHHNQETTEGNETALLQMNSPSEETANHSEMQNWQIKPSLLRPSYRAFLCGMDLMRIIETRKTSLDQIRHKYFRNYSWLPIISESRIMNGSRMIQTGGSSAASIILVFSMLLVTTNPFDDEDGISPLETHLYLTTKYQFSLCTSLSYPSIELVQAGVLIAVYEYSQGAADMAYVTIGTCARLSSLLGLHRAVSGPFNTTGEIQNMVEEANRTWWAIVVVDRYINMESLASVKPAAVNNPTPDMSLPKQYQPWPGAGFGNHSSPLSGGNRRVEWEYSFEASAARRLGQVQDLIRHNHNDEIGWMEKAVQVYNDLEETLTHIRRRQDMSLSNRFGGGFATAIGAALMLSLYICQKPRRSAGDDVWATKLQELCHGMAVICSDLEEVTLRPGLSLDSMQPSVISAIYYAALGHKHMLQMDIPSDVVFWDNSLFTRTLRTLSTRWGLAKRYLDILRPDEDRLGLDESGTAFSA